MKISKLLGKDPVSTIEAAIANLAARRETLNGRLADATAKFEAARSARKSALASDPTADLSALTQAVRDNEDEIETIQGVLHDLDEQHAEQEELLAKAKDEDVRAASAKELERVAGAVDKAAVELNDAIAALAKAASKMVGAIPPSLHVIDFSEQLGDGESDKERLVAAVIAEGIAHAIPSAFPTEYFAKYDGHASALRRLLDTDGRARYYATGELPIPTDARTFAANFISERLRDRAKDIVAGELSPDLDDTDLVPVRFRPKIVPTFPLVQIYSLVHFAYRTAEGEAYTIITSRWSHNVPEDVADAAVEAGVALRIDTPEGEKAFRDQQEARRQSPTAFFAPSVSLADCVNLGNVRALAVAEVEEEAA
ncbi:hypothetical protein NGM99_12655 [Mesorhizobium sp. RP14(2022)]|uniref:Phage major capsid protein n=1 Tax=Mesorhizobium liriopis TaxID=2953882 RepID=A0ABT1C744_9HYPH|nr:hypothetical protein [Mesorhizobium liriopis]MCO6050634.1 hypothetical protein [Mesorhizobium liriopis]